MLYITSSLGKRALTTAMALTGLALASAAHAPGILHTAIAVADSVASATPAPVEVAVSTSQAVARTVSGATAPTLDLLALADPAEYPFSLLDGDWASYPAEALSELLGEPGSTLGAFAIGGSGLLSYGHGGFGPILARSAGAGGGPGLGGMGSSSSTGSASSLAAAAPTETDVAEDVAEDTAGYWGVLVDDSGGRDEESHENHGNRENRDDTFVIADATPHVTVPEPGTLSLLLAGMLAAGLARRRRAPG